MQFKETPFVFTLFFPSYFLEISTKSPFFNTIPIRKLSIFFLTCTLSGGKIGCLYNIVNYE